MQAAGSDSNLVLVEYHPYRGDTFFLADDSLRAGRYTHSRGQPALAVDGRQRPLPDRPADYDSTFRDYFRLSASESSFIDLRLRGAAGPQQCSVFVTGVKLDEEPPNPNLRLYCIVLEDSLSVPSGIFNRVPRRFLTEPGGRPFLLAARYDSLTDTLTFNPQGFRLDKLSVAAFVEDASDTLPIKQAARLRRFF